MKRNTVISIALILLIIIALSFSDTTISIAADKQVRNYEKVIAHGGGAYRGYETTNSVEAVNNSIKNGFKMIELDMEFSSDDKIIMLHDWDRTTVHYFGKSFDNKITERQFLNLTVHGQFEVLTFDKLTKILDKYPDVKIVTDTKGDNEKLLTKIALEYPNYKDRITPQIYDYDEYEWVKELGYTDIIFTLYAQAKVDIEKLINFIRANDIYAVTMPDYYVEKGICKELAASGAIVYVHPVGSYEKAKSMNKKGAYGVYSGTLIPEEFEGLQKDVYLIVSDEKGNSIKLTDKNIDNLNDIKIIGLKTGDHAEYFIDNNNIQITDCDITTYQKGKHKLSVKLYNKREQIGQLDYFIWIEEVSIRIVHKKFEYRLDAVKEPADFNTVMDSIYAAKELVNILENSFIAKKGEYFYYSNSFVGSFMNGKEFLPVQKSTSGKLLLPLGTAAIELGANSVIMAKGKDIVVSFNKSKYRSVINSYCIRNGFIVKRIKTPIELYLNKAMAGGEILEQITGRTYLEKDDIIIILPLKSKLDKSMERQLIDSAQNLFAN